MCPVHEASNRGGLVGENGLNDMFPINMRVLAVDDDKTCLGILEKMLRKCQYQVTTESRAVEALRILRENRDNYDLVISDVKMPDINGLELLKVIGLEMDLPVIMLSDYSDTDLVMEGITHGACDYLSKPIRIEELKNIWQHVVRRRKFDPKDRNNAPSLCPNPSFGNDHQSENSDRKRKDHGEKGEEDEEDVEEDGSEKGDSLRQKKPRVVWSMELHQKFVVAVHQLGLDKAVPKKILDLMNHEGLTRENVASHLQKFRIYLKKLHQDKMAALGGKNASYMRMASLDGFRHFSNASLPSYPGLRFRGVSPSENMNRSYGNNLHSSILPSNQNPSLFQGISPSLDYKEFGSIDDPSNPPITLRFRDQSSPRPVQFGTTGSFNASWQGRNQLASFPSSSLPMSAPFGQSQILAPPNSFVDTFSLSTPRICSNKMEMPSAGYLQSIVSPDGASMDQNGFVSKAETGTGVRPEMEFLLEQTKLEDGYAQSLDDIMNTFDKRELSTSTLLDGDYIWV